MATPESVSTYGMYPKHSILSNMANVSTHGWYSVLNKSLLRGALELMFSYPNVYTPETYKKKVTISSNKTIVAIKGVEEICL